MKLLKPVLGLLALACLLLPMAACTTLGDIGNLLSTKLVNPLNDQTVSQVGNTLGLVNGAVVGYAALPLCPVGHALTPNDYCHDKALLKQLHVDQVTALAAYGKLVDFQRNNPQGTTVVGGTFSTLLSQAQSAIATLTSLRNTYLTATGASS